MADILVLPPGPAAIDRLRAAQRLEAGDGGRHVIHIARGWPELMNLASRVSAAIAVVDPHLGPVLAHGEIQAFRRVHAETALIAYGDFAGRPASDGFHLALLGVREVLSLGTGDDPRALARVLFSYVNSSPFDGLLSRLGARVPPSILAWLAPALRSAEHPRTVGEIARLARCSPRTLRRLLHGAGLPSPDQVLGWRGVLHAGRLLADPSRSVEGVARVLGYSSGAALRKSFRRITGMTPTEARARGGLPLLIDCFLEQCGPPGPHLPLPVPAVTDATVADLDTAWPRGMF